jgi:Tol biopolymer transport system component
MILGTAGYMAPEQARGEVTDRRADIWAFGVVLYEMLARKTAFPGKTTADILASVLKQEPDWSALPDGTPAPLVQLLRRCLDKDRKQRLRDIGEARIVLDHPLDTVPPAALAAPAARGRRWLGWAAMACALAVGGAGFWAGQQLRPAAPSIPSLKFTRITHDAGLTFEPAISPDGKLVVYASDRSGKGDLDLWLQQVGGSGLPLQLTQAEGDEHEPTFSPDGSQIAFRSEKDGGGIYTMAALGGEPRLLVRGGRGPRWSPDGKQIAYWTGGRLSVAKSSVLVVPIGGGQPVDVSIPESSSRYPVWSPDGNHLVLLSSKRSSRAELWVVEPRESGSKRRLEGTTQASLFSLGNWWKGMMLLGSAQGLKAIPVSTGSWKVTGPSIDLTPGLAGESTPVASASGAIVFAGQTRRANIWALPINAATGKVTGSARQLTRNTNRQIAPALSPDGNLVAYQGQAGLVADIATGKEKLIVPPGGAFIFPNFSSDGRRIAFSSSVRDPKTGKISYPLLVANLAGDPPEQVCADCGLAPVWSPDGRKLVWDIGLPRYIGITDVANKKSERLTSAAERGVIQPSFSPDGRWILAEMEHGADRANIVVAPYRDGAQIQPSDWAPLTEPSGFDSRPRWSPDGNRLYFVSDRDGFRCIWTTPLHPETKRSLGPAAAVAHFHEAKLSIPNIGSIAGFGLSVGRDKLVFNLGEITGNIWLAQ